MKPRSRQGANGPAVPNAYGLQSSRDMLMKLEREMTRLASAHGQLDVIDHGLNVAMTAWHLVDWVRADIKRLPDWRVAVAEKIGLQAKVLKYTDFENYAREQCPELRYCRIVTNSAMHAHCQLIPGDPKFNSDAASSPVPITWRNKGGQPIYWLNNQGEQVTFTSEAWDLWIIEGEERRRAVEVYERAIAWWSQLINNLPSHGP
jgi:hypothetical protein